MTFAAGRLSAAGSGQHLGSVFAVTRQLALTAFHCVRDDTGGGAISRVRCTWRNEISDAFVQDWDEYLDVAVLRLRRMLPDSLDPVPLTGDVVSHDQFVAPGAPSALDELHLAAVSGMVLLPDTQMPDGSPAIQLFCLQVLADLSLHGLSGAPVLTGNPEKAVGLVRWNPQQADHPELAKGALVFAAPARRILERWPELAPAANLPDLIRYLADHRRRQNVAGLYAGVRTLLLAEGLRVGEDDLRVLPAPHGGRSCFIAIDTAHTIISVERDLSDATVLAVAERELRDAVIERAAYADQRYTGVLTDGVIWRLYRTSYRQLQLVDSETVDSRVPEKLVGWLEAILATGRNIPPDRDVIESKLGSMSPSYKLDAAELSAIYQTHRDVPTVAIKRRMWAKLLTTASGTSFADEDSLFIDHTLLVAIAKVIGHAVLGFQLDSKEVTASALMSGALFTKAKITGVIEADFFDWITELPEGEDFVMNLAHRLSRFDWRRVDHDVLKQLYESVIPQATRHQLGEYYTPDWLAEAIIAQSVQYPLQQRVLDASCGSGTFLFHAIRSYMTTADTSGITATDAINGVVDHVIGIDVHPVAVTLARVTYLLAIGSDRLQHRQGFTVPVFLGDSMRWGQEVNLLTYDYDGLSVSTRLDPESFVTGTASPSESQFSTQLNFPDRVVANTGHFDLLVTKLADLATSRRPQDPIPPLEETFQLFGIRQDERPVLKQTFANMCRLHDEGKDHIWGYYVRNLARPAWLARPANQVDVLVGNPPWLVYRYMTGRQQRSFKRMCDERGLWAGGAAAPNQDLAALFVTRCIELYLRPHGQFGYVMPWSVLPRPGQRASRPHAGFRTGNYPTGSGTVKVAFTEAWDLHRVKPSFFPLAVCAIFGHRQQAADSSVPLPEQARSWTGRFDTKRAKWIEAANHVTIVTAEAPVFVMRQSPYAPRFTQGATIVPRLFFLVNPGESSPLGTITGQIPVRSKRSRTEKNPWKQLPDLTGAVEDEFIRPIYLGECVLPFRCLPPVQGVIPWDGHHLLSDGDLGIGRYPGLADWLHRTEAMWNQHRSSDRLSLTERLDYRHGLTRQFPASAYRVVYSKSGAYLAAAIIDNPSAAIDHKLYWGPVSGLDEARYLTAILNSDVLTMAVRPMQARGEHNPRDFDKYVFQLPIPQYDPGDAAHARLVVLAKHAEDVAAAMALPDVRFERQRKYIRDELERDGVAADINTIVKALLDITV
jgi:SAM-dependent methyltransferase